MRGEKIFSTVKVPETAIAERRKRHGRSPELVESRNECLADRYYYYRHFTALRYEKIMEKLEAEFWLSRITITQIMAKQLQLVKTLAAQKPAKIYFSEKWPHMKW